MPPMFLVRPGGGVASRYRDTLTACSPVFSWKGDRKDASGSNADISSMQNIPEGIKQDLINQQNAASGKEKKAIGAKAAALNNMVGTQLVGTDPYSIADQQFHTQSRGNDWGGQGTENLPPHVGHGLLAPGPGHVRPVRGAGLPVLLLVDGRRGGQRQERHVRVDHEDRRTRAAASAAGAPLQGRQLSARPATTILREFPVRRT